MSRVLLSVVFILSVIFIPGYGRKYTCSELTYEEAQQLLMQGHTYLDRNNDGIACNGNKR